MNNSIEFTESGIEIRIESIRIELDKLKSKVERKFNRLTKKLINENRQKSVHAGDTLCSIYKLRSLLGSNKLILKGNIGYFKMDSLTSIASRSNSNFNHSSF